MAMKLQISEILKKLGEFTGEGSQAKKVEWLRRNDSATLRMILRHAFDPKIAYGLPESDPPYTPNQSPIGLAENNLFAETRRLSYLWLVPSKAALQDLTKEQQAVLDAATAQATAATDEYREALTIHKTAMQAVEDANAALIAAKQALYDAQRTVRETERALIEKTAIASRAEAAREQLRQQLEQVQRQLEGEEVPRTPATRRTNLPQYKLEGMFIELLESLHADEAEVLLAVKNKALSKRFPITKTVALQAFPDLLS